MAWKYNPFTGEFDLVLNPGHGTAAIEFDTDSGAANPNSSGVITIAGGTHIDTTGSGSTVTIEVAGTVATQYDTDSGSATASGGVLEIFGAGNATTSASGNTITINSEGILGPGSSTDNALVRWDGTSGNDVQNSVAILTDAGALSGLTQLDVDSLRLDGNTISSTNTNGDIVLTPNGSGVIRSDARGYDVTPGGDVDADLLTVQVTGTPTFSWDESETGFKVNSAGLIVGADGSLSYDVNGSTQNTDVEIHSSDAQDWGGLTLLRHSNTAAYGGRVVFLRSDGTHSSPLIVADNDVLMRLSAAGWDGTDWNLAAEISVEVDGTPGANDMPGRIVFSTSADGSNSPTEAMRINEDQTITLANALPVGSGGTGATTLTDGGILLGSGTGPITATSQPTDGQLLIGSTGSDPTLATLTEGAGIDITNASGSITIAGTGGGFAWTEVTGTSDTLVAQNGYIANNASLVTLTLPSTAALGDTIQVVGKGAGLFKIGQNASQTIYYVSSATTTGTGGSLTAIQQYAAIELVCITVDNDWAVLDSSGSFTVV